MLASVSVEGGFFYGDVNRFGHPAFEPGWFLVYHFHIIRAEGMATVLHMMANWRTRAMVLCLAFLKRSFSFSYIFNISTIVAPCNELYLFLPFPLFPPEGRQTRSRVILSWPSQSGQPCPSELWQTRTCTDGPCVTYNWKVSAWRGDHRDIWCESSDGVKVKGQSLLTNHISSLCLDLIRCPRSRTKY